MTEIWPEIMVTAHRNLGGKENERWVDEQLLSRLRMLRDDYGLVRVTTGMAPGGDHRFGLAAMRLDIPVRAAIPYPTQPYDGEELPEGGHRPGPRWTRRDREIWIELKEYAQATGGVKEVFPEEPRDFKHRVRLLHQRNDWMLAQHPDQVIAIWDPTHDPRSGTTSCLRKAASAGHLPILFNLAARRVSRPEPKHWAAYLNMPGLLRAKA